MLGKGRYLQLALINKHWHSLYTQLYPDCKTAVAAAAATVQLLAWARDCGYVWNARTAFLIAKGGHLEVLQWARANGCPWDAWTCAGSAKRGHLKVC